jgi:tartrate-resistant acid phosphatase type 5
MEIAPPSNARRRRRVVPWACAALLSGALAAGYVGVAQETLDLLPQALRAAGRAALEQADPGARAAELSALARQGGSDSSAFLIAVLDDEADPAVRIRIVRALGNDRSPRVQEALARQAESDADSDVALAALQALHTAAANRIVAIVERRLEQSTDAERSARLRAAHDHWLTLALGAMLPAFLREPPPVFEARPSHRSVRVLAFGDFGSGDPEQREVARAIGRLHQQRPIDFGLTLGDNVYPKGMRSPTDPRARELWNDVYDALGITFYASLGNHDWASSDSPAAEVLFTRPGSTWQMPATHYTFRAGPAQFFALDTTALSAEQLAWLARELDRSPARWKIVYGHHPIRSAGKHGDSQDLVERLLPVLANRADLYLAGHDHDMQQLETERGVALFVVGGGGAGVRPVTPGPRSLFAASSHGFAVLQVEAEQVTVELVNTELKTLHSATLR